MDLWEDLEALEKVAGEQNHLAYKHTAREREVPVKCIQGDQKNSLRLVSMNWATVAKYKSVELLGDHGLCPLILFSHRYPVCY